MSMMEKNGSTKGTFPVAVSVVIPVYNVEKYLDETIQSVLNQELQDFEIILVNDGSLDSSAAICQKYASLDPRIYFFDQDNAGVSVARNNGLSHARGEYVYFLDSDDTIASEFLLGAFTIARNSDADIVVLGEYFTRMLPSPTALPTCGQMVKRDFLVNHADIRFPAGIQPCEDGLFSHRLLALTTKLAAYHEAIYFYRQHGDQNHVKIHDDCWKVLHQIPQWLDILKQFYQSHTLLPEKALHLAKFLEHEPFYLRYTEMPLDADQKKYLFDLIRSFFFENIEAYLKPEQKESFGKPFLFFLNTTTYLAFDSFYVKYKKSRARKKKIYLLLTKLILVSPIKKKVRHYLRNYY
jgi:glycosyltransferase involved in cell wall biosynthesis